jgi:hypothetical protein
MKKFKQVGNATFAEYFSVNRALINRAIDEIRSTIMKNNDKQKIDDYDCQEAYQDYMRLEDIDSIGPVLLTRGDPDAIPF